MSGPVKRRYDNSRRSAQAQATRRKVIDVARELFIDQGYPATTIEAIAAAADTPLPTLYRQFGSKRALLEAVLDTALGGDDEPVAFVDRPAVQAALAEIDPERLIDAFARLGRELLERSAAVQHVLATAATIDPQANELLAEVRRQRHAGQSRIIAALARRDALDRSVDRSELEDITYALFSPDLYRVLTVERGWSNERYEAWLARLLKTALEPSSKRRRRPTS